MIHSAIYGLGSEFSHLAATPLSKLDRSTIAPSLSQEARTLWPQDILGDSNGSVSQPVPGVPMTPPNGPALSDDDRRHLAQFDGLREVLAARAKTVALGFQNGAYIVGPPRHGQVPRRLPCARRDGGELHRQGCEDDRPGLLELLHDNREKTIVLDDIPSLAAERAALQILMAALGGKPGEPRLITYTSAEVDKGRRSFDFRGGIIALSNVPLRQDPLAKAVASRVPTLEHNPTDDMLIAFMREQAVRGYKELTPAEALETVDFAVAELRASESRVDLRVMPKALEDRRFWASDGSDVHWTELVRSSIKVLSAPSDQPVTRDATKEKERRIALDLFRRFPGQEESRRRDDEWRRATGKSVDTLLRHWRALHGAGAA